MHNDFFDNKPANLDSSARYYSFKAVSYASRDELQPLLDKCKKYALIYHDRDVDDDGELLSPHYHVLCTFDGNRSFSSFRKLVKSDQNTLVRVMDDRWGAFEYLDHHKEPNKYQYDPASIETNDRAYFTRDRPANKDVENAEFVDMLVKHARREISARDMATRYGRDFIRNYKNYQYFAAVVLREECGDNQNNYPEGVNEND